MQQSNEPVRVCFVCLGNICRSPTAEGVFHRAVDNEGLSAAIRIDSAGTGGWHSGELADPRARRAAAARDITLESRARKFERADFDRFDYVIAMDRSNRKNLERLANGAADMRKIHLFRSFDESAPPDAEVPDPYYGGDQGFEDVLDMCERASAGLLAHIKESGEVA
ncbi:MAG: low molecular weight protein-tyrosine-phosphatase [Myxococcota bacterium]